MTLKMTAPVFPSLHFSERSKPHPFITTMSRNQGLLSPDERLLVEQELIRLSQANQEALARLSTPSGASTMRGAGLSHPPSNLLGMPFTGSRLFATPSSSSSSPIDTAAALIVARHHQGAAVGGLHLPMDAGSSVPAGINAMQLKRLQIEQEMQERRRLLGLPMDNRSESSSSSSSTFSPLERSLMLQNTLLAQIAKQTQSDAQLASQVKRKRAQLSRDHKLLMLQTAALTQRAKHEASKAHQKTAPTIDSAGHVRLSSFSPIRKRKNSTGKEQQARQGKVKSIHHVNMQPSNFRGKDQEEIIFTSLPPKKRSRTVAV